MVLDRRGAAPRANRACEPRRGSASSRGRARRPGWVDLTPNGYCGLSHRVEPVTAISYPLAGAHARQRPARHRQRGPHGAQRHREPLGRRRLAPRAAGSHRLRPPLRAPDVPGRRATSPAASTSAALMAEGGRLNATTWFDRTNYFETVPKGALELALWLEADRHGHLLDARHPGEPRQPARRRQGGEAPALRQRALRHRPHRHLRRRSSPRATPTTTRRSARWRTSTPRASRTSTPSSARYYGPNNTVLTLVGDVTAGGGVRRRRAVLRPAAGLGRAAAPRHAQLAPLAEPVRVDRVEDVPNDRLHLAFRLPVDRHPSSSPAASPSTSSAGSRPPGSCSGWSAPSRPPRRRRLDAWASSTGSSLGLHHRRRRRRRGRRRGRGRRVRGARAVRRRGPDRRGDGVRHGRDRALLAQRAGQPGGARRPHQPPRAAARATRPTSTRSSTGSAP